MIIYQTIDSEVAARAASELAKYVGRMCGDFCEIKIGKGDDGIVLGLFDELGVSSEGVLKPDLDDAFDVKVDGLKGYIAGSNERSILYGVYAYLKKAGCRFIRPGKDGDYVPNRDLWEFKTEFREVASYRFRYDCIEGSVNYETTRDYIYWLPKIGFNGYMLQGTSPFGWYDRWFSHQGNKYKKARPLSVKEADALTKQIEADVKKSGMTLHSVGHGYMAPAFGLYGETTEEEIDAAGMRPYVALVNGERKIMYGSIGYTNLCYSDPFVRGKIVEFFLKYVEEKPNIDFVHIWLADQRNNYCECERCQEISISDQLVDMLNDVDDAFTKNGIKARMVLELYNDTCWAPINSKIKNPDRFVLLTAIRQNYVDGYTKHDPDIVVPEHILNHYNVPPNNFPMTMGFLRDWKKVFSGDGFFFDYHLYSDHYVDPGYCQVASRLARDTRMIADFGTQGIMHCSSMRRSMPNTYPQYLGAEVLMNRDVDEAKVQKEYFEGAYGEDADKAYKYLSTLSELFQPDLLRDMGTSAADEQFDEAVQIHLPYMNNPVAQEKFLKIPAVVADFMATIEKNLSANDPCHRKSWYILKMHTPIVLKMAEGLAKGAAGDLTGAQKDCVDLIDFLSRNEDIYMHELDHLLFVRRLRMMFGITGTIFAPVE